MGAPQGYFEAEGWWWFEKADMPTKSIFPIFGGPLWKEGEIPVNCGGGYRGKSVQGWKLHVCVHPEDIEGLFVALYPVLRELPHKFTPFEIYSKQRVGFAAFQLVGKDDGDSAAGKACVIYPSSPTKVKEIVPCLDKAIRQANELAAKPIRGRVSKEIRPFPGGVKGDLSLGNTGFVYCRYGAFQGELARKNQVYNPDTKKTCLDPRFNKPFPDFIRVVPIEIKTVLPKEKWGQVYY